MSTIKEYAKSQFSKHCIALAFNDKETGQRVYFIKTWYGIKQLSKEKYFKRLNK